MILTIKDLANLSDTSIWELGDNFKIDFHYHLPHNFYSQYQ